MRSIAAALAVFPCLALVLAATGCASQRELNVLVPGDGVRAAQVVPLAPEWAGATVKALRASPGCLGVEFSQTGSGKRVISAMFKDKASLVLWYGSEIHQNLVGKVGFYRQHEHIAGAGIPGDAGPILVIATMTPVAAADGVPPGTVLLSVELFSPLPGGVRFGGASFLPR